LSENNVRVLHQQELIDLAHAIVNEEFTLATRGSADRSMAELQVSLPDVVNVLRTCHTITMNFAAWPCAEYHGWSLDGEALVVVAVVHYQEKIVRLLKVWKL
jgi:hypothetical protein